MRRFILLGYCMLVCLCISANPSFSTAGFFELAGSGRTSYSLNPNWKFAKGAHLNAADIDFDDSKWEVVSVPDGVELLPRNASGCLNYQGEVWYRKHLNLTDVSLNKRIIIHFEAIMGKSKIFINGVLVKENFGGYLPVIVDATEHINKKGDNVIAVWADNSDDIAYPPGKVQKMLDFAYFGGIYRDVWLVTHGNTFITDPNHENITSGGGLAVWYNNVSAKKSEVGFKVHLKNSNSTYQKGKLEMRLLDDKGKVAGRKLLNYNISPSSSTEISDNLAVVKPNLWTPENPYLYQLQVRVLDARGKVIDGYYQRIGIRSFEFKGEDGFWLNGEPYEMPLIGANRHQDYAIVGNAVSNNAHWRDAKKLRDAGLKVIRNAHYPQDPAFMDACDELGLLVIVNTPGWQFWNDNPIFEQRVYSDIRNMVRRDRNHASVWMWEPVLNETWYPDYFAKRVNDIVHEEYPYPSCYTACDASARGNEYFPIQFGHPSNADKEWAIDKLDSTKTYFTREWGDNVDTWMSHNSPSRVAREWGESAMLTQAQHYAKPSYDYTSYDALYKTSRQHIGGALWHAFDHQRGYHPDPFYGGLMDVFRQPKYSYYLFKAQRDPRANHPTAESGPVLHIAHEMTPFSSKDVTVYSNCDEVHLQYTTSGTPLVYKKEVVEGMPSPIITFENAYDFMVDKKMSMYEGKENEVFLAAKGFIDGKLVAVDTVYPSRRPVKLVLEVDAMNTNLVADGSDFVTVIASVTDEKGNVKHLSDYYVEFIVEGEGELIADEYTYTNPVKVEWGSAPILLRSTVNAGEIKVRARSLYPGLYQLQEAEIIINSVPSFTPLIYVPMEKSERTNRLVETQKQATSNALEELNEVSKQQLEFGENR